MWRYVRIVILLGLVVLIAKWCGAHTETEVGESESFNPAPATLPQVAKTRDFGFTEFDSDYDEALIQGWSVRVRKSFIADQRQLVLQTLTLLDNKLADIARVVPAHRVQQLQDIPIWVEEDVPGMQGMQYHWSANWLSSHGFNPAKARSVDIPNAATFISWEPTQPWFVLHEMAHGFQDRYLGETPPSVVAAYEHAKTSGLYASVKRNTGEQVAAYALTNANEYFAELTEAYFGINDFYPFNRQELQAYDPDGYALMVSVWQ